MSYSFDSIRAKIKNEVAKTGIKADVLYIRYLSERFICRIANSAHKDSVIIKGGMLISAIVGVNMRSTRDLDATIIGAALTKEDFENIVKDIILVDLQDNIKFEFIKSEEILVDNTYPCQKIHLRAYFGTMKMKLEIDMTTGDIITPKEVDFGFPTLFGDDKIPILAYNIETILAEKITAILDLHIYSTRPKDFYDMYLFARSFEGQIDKTTLKTAVNNTLTRKHKEGLLQRAVDIMGKVIASEDIKAHWRKYQQEYIYAKDVEFEQVIIALGKIFSYLDIEIIPSV